MSMTSRRISWVLQVVVALVLLQTLFFKFTAAPESVYIFSTLGIEPWGRIGSGVAEFIAAVLLSRASSALVGALFSLAIISGAIMSHLTVLGIEVMGDGGTLFALALLVFGASAAIVWLRRSELAALVALRSIAREVRQ
jgi:hypothetical protein